MNNIGIVANLDRDIGGKYLAAVAAWLFDKGLRPIILSESKDLVHTPCHVTEEDELFRKSDIAIVLGGDGTMLWASKPASQYNTPLIGINLGTLGYLTDAETGGGLLAIEKVLEGKYTTERRMMLEAEILEEDFSTSYTGMLALNDVCILRGPAPRIKSFSLYINDNFLDTYKADGVIISTPTGSTAYNLAAGGPILKPDIETIAITAICPHNMHSRPLVVSGSDIVSLEIKESYEQDAVLALDGQEYIDIKKGQSVRVKRSKNYMTLIKTKDQSFYNILRIKLH